MIFAWGKIVAFPREDAEIGGFLCFQHTFFKKRHYRHFIQMSVRNTLLVFLKTNKIENIC